MADFNQKVIYAGKSRAIICRHLIMAALAVLCAVMLQACAPSGQAAGADDGIYGNGEMKDGSGAGTVETEGGFAAGSGTGHVSGPGHEAYSRLDIVTTVFPLYDWTMAVLGDTAGNAADTRLLLGNGTDMHSYQPTVDDIINISECDVFIYVGGESDEWIEDVLANADISDMRVLCLMDVLGDAVRMEETVEGMQEERERLVLSDLLGKVNGDDARQAPGNGTASDSTEDDGEEAEYDEHVWLSLRNAQICCAAICEALCEAYPDRGDIFRSNTEEYMEQLEALDAEYCLVTENAAYDTLLFADRFPFRYMVDDYGLLYYAAFPGCSAESEAGFETIIFLADKLEELGLPCVLTTEASDRRLADTIIGCTSSGGQPVLTLNSMQSVTSKDIEDGAGYIGIMRDNLTVLERALNG